MRERFLITGGAGFVGASLCQFLKEEFPQAEIVALDNLYRRGSELNVPILTKKGVRFAHGDIRELRDLEKLEGNFDFVIEASAEPSVTAGLGTGSPHYVLDTNLKGTINCLEFSRTRAKGFFFLSTSRVYSIKELKNIPLKTGKTRFEPSISYDVPGFTQAGIAENFPSIGAGSRSLYGTTKLASELLVEEYAHSFGIPAIINRCGVIAGPGQFGKTDQGVFTLWVARHVYGGSLKLTGFGGKGLQVRDLLHPRDLYSLLRKQMNSLTSYRGDVFCVGGGNEGSVSLLEYTKLCEEIVGRNIPIGSDVDSPSVDIPYFVTDASKAKKIFDWHPSHTPTKIVSDIFSWLKENSETLKPLFGEKCQ